MSCHLWAHWHCGGGLLVFAALSFVVSAARKRTLKHVQLVQVPHPRQRRVHPLGRDAAQLAIVEPRVGGIKHSDRAVNGQALQRVARERVRKRKVTEVLGGHKRTAALQVVQHEAVVPNVPHSVRKIDKQDTAARK